MTGQHVIHHVYSPYLLLSIRYYAPTHTTGMKPDSCWQKAESVQNKTTNKHEKLQAPVVLLDFLTIQLSIKTDVN